MLTKSIRLKHCFGKRVKNIHTEYDGRLIIYFDDDTFLELDAVSNDPRALSFDVSVRVQYFGDKTKR